MSGSGELIFWLVVIFMCCLCLGSKKDREEKKKKNLTKDVSNQELSSWLDMLVKQNSLANSYISIEDPYEAEKYWLESDIKYDKNRIVFEQELVNFHGKSPEHYVVYFQKIEEEVSNCDEWDWSQKKEVAIGKD